MPSPRSAPQDTAAQTVAPDVQRSRIEALTAALARDALTQLINRTGFAEGLRREIQSIDPDFGHVLVFRQRDLSEINRSMPRELTDQWLRTTAVRLTELLEGLPDSHRFLLARLNGSDFAMLMPGIDSPHAVVWSERVRQVLLQARVSLGDGLCRWALGLMHYTHGDNVADLMASLDHTLMRSEIAGADCLVVGDDTSLDVATGEFAWHDTLVTALDQNRFFLTTQVHCDTQRARVREDAVLMLQTEAGAPPVAPEIFIPAAVRLGLSAQCDLQAVRLGLDWLGTHSGTLTIRLSVPTLIQDNFLPRLRALLTVHSGACPRLLLEIDAQAVTTFYLRVRALNDMLTTLQAQMAIGRLSEQLTAIAQLHTLRLAYVRLGGPFMRGLGQSPGGQDFALSVASTLRALGIDVHAEDVPDEGCARRLQALGVHVMRDITPRGVPDPVADLACSADVAQPPMRGARPPVSARQTNQSERVAGHALVQRVDDALTNLSAEHSLNRQSGVMMAHEMRTPLSTISAAAQSLELILAGSGEMIDGRIARIRRAVTRLSELLDTFFHAQRDDMGALVPVLADVDMVALASQVLADMQSDIAHQLVLDARFPAAARCDASLTAVVLRNLLHNAIKYSPPNEPITISVASSVNDLGLRCEISVIDRGSGMAPDELQRIFDHHYRRPVHGEVKGSGIGLSIARRLCEIQGGRLNADSAPARGTALHITLPGLRTTRE